MTFGLSKRMGIATGRLWSESGNLGQDSLSPGQYDRPGIFQFFKKIAKSELPLQRLFNI